MAVSNKYITEEIDAALRERLSEHRFEHSLSVASFARKLARMYNVDPDLAYAAGYLHDWDKDVPYEEQVAHAVAHGVDVPANEQMGKRVLHAESGAADLAEKYPELPAEIISAIAKHTLAAVEMSELDMIIYVADMIEPTRSYKRASELRDQVGGITLPLLYKRAFTAGLTGLIEREKPIHPRALEVWNAFADGAEAPQRTTRRKSLGTVEYFSR